MGEWLCRELSERCAMSPGPGGVREPDGRMYRGLQPLPATQLARVSDPGGVRGPLYSRITLT
jgi:hypothetical protein